MHASIATITSAKYSDISLIDWKQLLLMSPILKAFAETSLCTGTDPEVYQGGYIAGLGFKHGILYWKIMCEPHSACSCESGGMPLRYALLRLNLKAVLMEIYG